MTIKTIVFVALILSEVVFYSRLSSNLSIILIVISIVLSLLFVKSWSIKWLLTLVGLFGIFAVAYKALPSKECHVVSTEKGVISDCDCLGLEKFPAPQYQTLDPIIYTTECVGKRTKCYSGEKVSIYFSKSNGTSSVIKHPEREISCE